MDENKESKTKRQTWYVRKEDGVITAADLKRDPNKYGGAGAHMHAAIMDGVITIPLTAAVPPEIYGSCVSIQVTDVRVARKILRAGKVDIISKGYWVCVNSVLVVYHGTDTEIPRWGKTLADTVIGKPRSKKG
jgi:hypothetical protein